MSKWNRNNNCYGYATKTPQWLLIESDYSHGVDELLERNPRWKLVGFNDMVLGKEYVAYRYGAYDFHFMRRNKLGYWRHKMGGSAVKAISTKDVFARTWESDSTTYDSKLYLFEVA